MNRFGFVRRRCQMLRLNRPARARFVTSAGRTETSRPERAGRQAFLEDRTDVGGVERSHVEAVCAATRYRVAVRQHGRRRASDLVEVDCRGERVELARVHESRAQADVTQRRYLHLAGILGRAGHVAASLIILAAAQADVEVLVVRKERRNVAARAPQVLHRLPARRADGVNASESPAT